MSALTGFEIGDGMREALRRMEQGADSESIEQDLGEVLEGEDPFVIKAKKGIAAGRARAQPGYDETLYDL